MQNLVIVESPTKAKTLSKFLGGSYQIEASMGHVRDLPKADLGVDIEHDFEPKYIIPKDKVKKVNQLKKAAKGVKVLWLATDPDREGEAIAWHLSELLRNSEQLKTKDSKLKSEDIKRVVFHEITQQAIEEAFQNPRHLDLKLVDAQQARRVLDRIVGYQLSPVLWKKVKSGLSAGRVQSVALRLVVEREKEILAFKPVEYWNITAELETSAKRPASTQRGEQEARFQAILIELNGKKLIIKNQTQADTHVKVLEKAGYIVEKITQKEVKRHPYPPFTTSTLQQAGANRLGFSAKKTMSLAQFLYEHGLITYMRTDSLNLSISAINFTRNLIAENFGKNYLPQKPKFYKSKSKNIQEAHEAIRPTDIKLKAQDLKHKIEAVTRDHIRLYELIWQRMLSCQMNEAVVEQTSVDIKAENYTLRATGSIIKFDGWLKVYGKSQEQEDGEEGKQLLPQLSEGEDLRLEKLLPEQHFTEPPPRYNEASLIKKLEELGIGRPSTYAPTLSTIQERFYVEKIERKFSPTPVGIAVSDFLVTHFPEIVDYSFTAQMEDDLDNIAEGQKKWKEVLGEFYKPFEKTVENAESSTRVKIASETIDKACPKCGKPLVIKYGRFGKFLACSTFPECKHTENFEEKLNMKCPKCGTGEIILRKTKKGRPFYGCSSYPECDFASWNKPKA